MAGWNEELSEGDMRRWRNSHGDVMTLSVLEDDVTDFSPLSDTQAWQEWARKLAETRTAGLIEIRTSSGKNGPAVALIYKRLKRPAYVFTGMLIIPKPEKSQIWTVVAGECGTTGVREAVVTAELLEAGTYTIEDYQSSWAQDPYDSGYHGVDRSVLRFVSDDECYDERFLHHPLTRIRRTLAALPESVLVVSHIM